MTFYTPSVAVDPIQGAPSIVSQPTSQAVVLANPKYVTLPQDPRLSASDLERGTLIAGIDR